MQNLNQTPFVSIVIPVLNCESDVLDCVASLKSQDYPSEFIELFIVDNGSTDSTKEKILSCDINYVLCPDRGRARALNYGILKSKGDVICTTDISCRPEKNWITTIVNDFINYSDVACVAGDIRLLKTHSNLAINYQEQVSYMSPMHAIKRNALPYFPFADGANASFRKEFFDEVGLFEDSFIKAADVEICNRLFILSDYKILFDFNAIVWEPGEPTLKDLLKQHFRMGIGWNLIIKKYPLLFQVNKKESNIKIYYWRLRKVYKSLKKFILGLFQKYNTNYFDIINFLMKVSQKFGQVYGKFYLKKKNISPVPIKDELIMKYLESNTTIGQRLIIIEKNQNDSCDDNM